MSKWSGFHRRSAEERLALVAEHAGLDADARAAMAAASALPFEQADAFVENAVGTLPVPLGFAVGFVIDGSDVVVPMAVEESSVIAAASHGAKLAAAGGGFATTAMPPVTIAQIELRDVPDVAAAHHAVQTYAQDWMARLDGQMTRMVARGGGMRRIVARDLGDGHVVVHLHVDCRDAMGANLVNTLAEGIAPDIAAACGGRIGLRILSNLATERLATATARIPVDAVGGAEVAQAMVEANDFARLDPYRAATHNKGIMNGIDPVVLASGNDWRAVEAGAHAFAAMEGHYQGLTRYELDGHHLVAELTLPMTVGTVGGVTALHPTARAALQVLGAPDATRLARIITAVGLAQNISALKALATEGIQRGHMGLHARNVAMQAGLSGKTAERVARQMAEDGHVSIQRALDLAGAGP